MNKDIIIPKDAVWYWRHWCGNAYELCIKYKDQLIVLNISQKHVSVISDMIKYILDRGMENYK
jgi:hypothetical protein